MTPSDLTTLAGRLRSARESAGLDKPALGALIGRVPVAVYHWEKGRAEPSLEMIERVALHLGVRAAWLAFGDLPRRVRRAA